ncbi:LysR substrate-binding domain-containing protein [Vogesella facilis]|uniref:LysR substrate-binding domain-containing protein n=1 Tax=Vogesella facilis TaxID=1655232 RepID=A0ABV7RCI7_9NEIS
MGNYGGENVRLRQPVARLESDNYDFLLGCLLDGHGLQFLPTWSAAPYLQRGELVEAGGGQWQLQSAFGPWVHVLYLPHRRSTRKVKVFIDILKTCLAECGLSSPRRLGLYQPDRHKKCPGTGEHGRSAR